MNVLLQQRWLATAKSILSELGSQAHDAYLRLGRWLDASSKIAETRIMVGSVAAAVAAAVCLVMLIAFLLPA